MATNKNLKKARSSKNDEFYTQLKDIENELKYYKEHFKNKVVYCNTDNYKTSNFVKYFINNFEDLGLKKLIATYYNQGKQSEVMISTGSSDVNILSLLGDGDFRSKECIEMLKESDIVVTNPPFSLYREYVAQLMEYEKDFLIIGNFNSVTYKEIFPLIKEDKMWLGYTAPKEFIQPNGNIKKFGNINWFTNLDVTKRHEKIILYKEYDENEYPEYDNYDAIEVPRVNNIPKDYEGVMGVPITFLTKYNPDQFKIIDMSTMSGRSANYWTLINGKPKYARVYIKHIKPERKKEE